MKDYEVEFTLQGTVTCHVQAESKAEAVRKILEEHPDWSGDWSHTDERLGGVRSVTDVTDKEDDS